MFIPWGESVDRKQKHNFFVLQVDSLPLDISHLKYKLQIERYKYVQTKYISSKIFVNLMSKAWNKKVITPYMVVLKCSLGDDDCIGFLP